MLAIDLIPLTSSRIFCTLSCRLDLLLSLIPCLIFFADVSLSGPYVFSVHMFSSFDEGQRALGLCHRSISSSVRAAVTNVCCSSISVCSYAVAAIVAACYCSSTSATSFAAAVALRRVLLLKCFRFRVCCCRRRRRGVLLNVFPLTSLVAAAAVVVVCCRSSISDSSCVAASCLPVNLFSSSSHLLWTSWRFSDVSGSSRGSFDGGYLAYLVSL